MVLRSLSSSRGNHVVLVGITPEPSGMCVDCGTPVPTGWIVVGWICVQDVGMGWGWVVVIVIVSSIAIGCFGRF